MPMSFLKGSEWELSPGNTMRPPEKVFGSLQLLFDWAAGMSKSFEQIVEVRFFIHKIKKE